ncbi:MAG: XdhC family protein [Acidimicrobiales bacterium]
MTDGEVVTELAGRLERGEASILVTAVGIEGAPPCHPGQKLLVGPTGPLAGTLGCAELDSQAVADAPALLASGQPARRAYDHELGRVDAYLEPYVARPLLLVLGATPVAAWLLRWAPGVGYDTALVDPRPERITPELSEMAGATASSPGALGLAGPVASPGAGPAAGAGRGTGTAADPDGGLRRVVDAVHTDHDAPQLALHLAWLLTAGARFVGVMGSARHVGPHLESMASLGVPGSQRALVRSPVGLDIGARTPAEIALSILAGLVAARSGRDGGWLDRRPG